MAHEFRLPDLGEGVHEGQIVRLFVAEGASINEDDPLMEVETDKASVEIPSPFTGTVVRWHTAENALVHVGDVMVTFERAGQPGSPVKESPPLHSGATTSPENQTTAAGSSVSPVGATPPRPTVHRRASPAVRKLARSLHVDLNTITGTGHGGRITRTDIEQAANGTSAMSPAESSLILETTGSPPLPVTPIKAPPAAPRPATTPAALPKGTDGADNWGPTLTVPNSMARRTIAANMMQSWTTIPHVTDCQDADITHLDKIRRGFRAPENDELKITVLAFVVRSVALALTRYPVFNAVFDADAQAIVYHRYVNIAIGVHTTRGLMTPVIRSADQLSIREIAMAIKSVGEKARTNSFEVADLRGGTYTISNVGAVGNNRHSTPIITPGQCAVLALGRARMQPTVIDGEIVPRLVLPLSHSFDHRIADGGDEVMFMGEIIGALENPARILI